MCTLSAEGVMASEDAMDTESPRATLLEISRMIRKSLNRAEKKVSSRSHSSTTTTASDNEGILYF